jgi:hypothetical protein
MTSLDEIGMAELKSAILGSIWRSNIQSNFASPSNSTGFETTAGSETTAGAA